MATMTAPLPSKAQPSRRWYQEPYVWLVLGGPLAVVVASMITIYLAVSGADPVLDRSATAVRVNPAAVQPLTPDERVAAERAMLPAGQGRNHAVTPALPKD